MSIIVPPEVPAQVPDWARGVLEDGTPFWVERIDKATARDLIVREHYSHSWNSAFGTHCFGVFDGQGLAGALVFGNLMNTGSYASIADLPPDAITELNRMWIDDRLGPNTETAALSRAMRWLRHNTPIQLVQTFADGRLGCGTVYKAANFTYYGHEETLFFEDPSSGEVIHGTRFSNTGDSRRPGMIPRGMLLRNHRLARGELAAFYVKTHRYLYPLTKYARRRVILKPRPYPAYDRGVRRAPDYVAPVSQVARVLVIAEACRYDDIASDVRAYMAAHFTPETVASARVAALRNEWVVEILSESDSQPDLFGLIYECRDHGLDPCPKCDGEGEVA